MVIANTSNMPMMAREASIYTGVTVAEYFRDMGYHVVVIADSTSRWAEALREFASRSGALPAEEGYPAGLASALAAFYERAGHVTTLGGAHGSVTVIGAVSPPGGDLTEPVTAHTQRFVRSLWTLDRDLAYARHYPAVSWSGSFSRDAAVLAGLLRPPGRPEWAHRRGRVLALLAEADRLTALAELVGAAAMPGSERMVMLAGRLLRDGVLRQSATQQQRRVLLRRQGRRPGRGGARRRGPVPGAGRVRGVRLGAGGGRLRPAAAGTGGDRSADADAVRRHGQAMLAVLEGLR